MTYIACPYCGQETEIIHDDGHGYDENETHIDECGNCGKNFVFETSWIIDIDPKKADCLNGEPHRYRPSMTYPREYTRMRCKDCGKSRRPTEAEWFDLMDNMEVI